MTQQTPGRPSLRDFDPYTDRNGQDNGEESPLDVANPAETQRELASNPDGEAETARVASGLSSEDHTDAVEAEVPRENLARISDPSLPRTAPTPAAKTGIDAATSVLGNDKE